MLDDDLLVESNFKYSMIAYMKKGKLRHNRDPSICVNASVLTTDPSFHIFTALVLDRIEFTMKHTKHW